MFEYLQQIDIGVYDRYLTLEKNIKASSNSFYDSYLDLQEHFLKLITIENGIEIAPHESCGALLKRSEVKKLFVNKYGLDEAVYGKMSDYAKKANEHKHRKEKSIESETIVKYMRLFYDVSSRVAAAKGLTVPQYDGNYFNDIFGKMDRTDQRLEGIEQSVEDIRKQIEIFNSSQSKQANTVNTYQDNGQVLKNFVAKAEKQYNWFGSEKDFKKVKYISVWVQLALIVAGIVSTVISSMCLKLYSTFTLFENIVMFGTFFTLAYSARAKRRYNDFDLAKHSTDMFVLDNDKIWRNTNKEKKRYKVFRRISYFAVVFNIICIWTMGSKLQILATVLEVIFLGLVIASFFTRENLFCMYNAIILRGYNVPRTEKVAIVFDFMTNKLYSYDEYKEKFYLDD